VHLYEQGLWCAVAREEEGDMPGGAGEAAREKEGMLGEAGGTYREEQGSSPTRRRAACREE
jgi:hypothetical protein